MSRNKVVLKLSHAHLFMYYHYIRKYFVPQEQSRIVGAETMWLDIYYLALYRKHLPTPTRRRDGITKPN